MARFGDLVGQVIAPRAEETDKHGPGAAPLRPLGRTRWTRSSTTPPGPTTRPTWCATGSSASRPTPGGPCPAVVTASLSYLVSQAETAIYCGLGMTAGAADIVERYAPTRCATTWSAGCAAIDPDQAWEGGMFLTERQGGSDVGANTTRAVQDGDEWRAVRREALLLQRRRRGVHRPGPARRRPRGKPGPRRPSSCPGILPDGSPNGFTIKRLKPKLGTVGVPTGEVHPRRRPGLAGRGPPRPATAGTGRRRRPAAATGGASTG